jgi:molybdopterin molybdotransferase
MDLLSVADARARILKQFASLSGEQIPLESALGRILSEDVFSSLDLPSFSNSGMDGFAVQSADVAGAGQAAPVQLQVVMDIPAGSNPAKPLETGQAARIMTGAMLPEGADSIVPVESTDHQQHDTFQIGQMVRIFHSTHQGEYVRRKGEDIFKGQAVLHAGNSLRPEDIGLLAMLGFASAPVIRIPQVAVLSSGDEIVPPGIPLEPGKIYDSNTFMLGALILQAGAQVRRIGVARDNLESVRSLLDQAAELKVDLIISSAGVSVGAFDFVRTAVEENGALDFWRVNMRPGKPFSFGSYREIPFVGLPGNPVSAYVGFEVFIRPVLAKMAGNTNVDHPATRVILGQAVESDGRETYLRASLKNENGRLVATLPTHQGSGNLNSLVLANALLILPSGVKSLPIGSKVDCWLLGTC